MACAVVVELKRFLQAEDMEFSECRGCSSELLLKDSELTLRLLVDTAYAETDPHRRIAFVAAFAMSNYSSTIGRIAKPFNPMLVSRRSQFCSHQTLIGTTQSETFEYVRLDKDFRYMSEQVSHHPPISACWAESPHWRYYGEVGHLLVFNMFLRLIGE